MEFKSRLSMKNTASINGDGVSSITCIGVPESIFIGNNAKKHFSKFGRVIKIILRPKKHMCTIEYESPIAAKRALLDSGAYDGFTFDVINTTNKMHRRIKKDDDPEWLPDSDVQKELSAMNEAPIPRLNRQKPMEIEKYSPSFDKSVKTMLKKEIPKEKTNSFSKPVSGTESPVLTTLSNISTAKAASELNQLRSRISLTPDEQWRTLDARDRILRAWGGNGARLKADGATVGTCTDMCPEKERLRRQAEHQVMTLEAVPDSDGTMMPWKAVKQYSRSSADQEMPMCYELRPARVLRMTCLYLLHEIADTACQVSLADWFHFMWDRFRSIRKDITQQALCCADSIHLVEMCARFHIHCAARLADLEYTQFDQKLNTDNLTKCLQTLKYMYADVSPEQKPHEAEFRGYIALLNLGDSNFWWEIKELPLAIQKAQNIIFAIQTFTAIDSNNYVKFFRLVKEKATYLQACILLRYFNDVRARGLARIVKAFAPRGGSKYPAEDLLKGLSFESLDSMKSFINHYGLRMGKTDDAELTIILDRHNFIEDSNPYPVSRAIELIESKRKCSVGEVVAGGKLPDKEWKDHKLYTSFNPNGALREVALISEDQGYNTTNDTNKSIQSLKLELLRIYQNGRSYVAEEGSPKVAKYEPAIQNVINVRKDKYNSVSVTEKKNKFIFKPAIVITTNEAVNSSLEAIPRKLNKNNFIFSKPEQRFNYTQSSGHSNMSKLIKDSVTRFNQNDRFGVTQDRNKSINIFAKANNTDFSSNLQERKEKLTVPATKSAPNIFADKNIRNPNIFNNVGNLPDDTRDGNKLFNNVGKSSSNVFSSSLQANELSRTDGVFGLPTNTVDAKTVFAANKSNLLKPNLETGNIFKQAQDSVAKNIFRSVQANKEPIVNSSTLFTQENTNTPNHVEISNIFKSAINSQELNAHSVFQKANKMINNIDQVESANVYDFNSENEDSTEITLSEHRLAEAKRREEEKQEEMKQEQLRAYLHNLEEDKKKEELRKREAEIRKQEQEELIKQEEKRQQEKLRKKIDEDNRQAEIKRKNEEENKFNERVAKETGEIVKEIVDEVTLENIRDLLKVEIENLRQLLVYAGVINDEIILSLCNSLCHSEMKAELHLTKRIMKKWFNIWRRTYFKNLKRRRLLETTPVWLPDKPLAEEVDYLRRQDQPLALTNIFSADCHDKFIGYPKTVPIPEPYKILDIIRSPFLKRMKEIHYPYDKCFFWKVTLISPGSMKWFNRKVELEPWLLAAFSDNKGKSSHSLIHVDKYCWNNLMDFAISVSLSNDENKNNCPEGIEGTNALLFYTSEDDTNLSYRIEHILNQKYPYQILPVAIIMPNDERLRNAIEEKLTRFVNNKIISCYKLFVVNQNDTYKSLNDVTKSSLRWLAKKYPHQPPLEVDLLKSLCQKHLGNQLWSKLKSEKSMHMKSVFKDLQRIIKLYNIAVDRLTSLLTNDDLHNYATFPLEFNRYLDDKTPYPKPYEFIPSSIRNSHNSLAIKEIMSQLKLPEPSSKYKKITAANMQEQIRKYSNQIGWFEDSEKVVCKVLTVFNDSNEFSEAALPYTSINYESYQFLDFLNVVVYEKINELKNFDNRLAIYEKSSMQEFSNSHWWYDITFVKKVRQRALELEDDQIDLFIKTKRQRLADESVAILAIEENDNTLVDDYVRKTDETIAKYHHCNETLLELEQKLEEERLKSLEIENLLKAALADD